MKLRKKIFFAILFVSIISLISVAIFSIINIVFLKRDVKSIEENEIGKLYNVNSKVIKKSTLDNISLIANEEANAVSERFNGVESVADILNKYLVELYEKNQQANVVDSKYLYLEPRIKYEDIEFEYKTIYDLKDILVALSNKYEGTNIYYVSDSGFIINVSSDNADLFNIDLRSREWFINAYKNGKGCWTDAYNDVITKSMVITYYTPLYDNRGNFKGAIAMDLILDFFCDRVLKSSIEQITDDYLSYISGDYIISSSGNDIKNVLGVYWEDYWSTIESSDSYGVYIKDGIIIAYSRIEKTGWILSLLFDYDKIINPIETIGRSITFTKDSILNAIQRVVILISLVYLLFLVLTIVAVIIVSKKVSNTITKPLYTLSQGTKEISKGNFNNEIIVNSNDEISDLANTFNLMSKELKEYVEQMKDITAKKERIATELKVANKIQMSMMPNKFPAFPNRNEFDIFALLEPARLVGGDFYDFLLVDDNHLAIVISDISGKGVSSALFMVVAKTIIKAELQNKKFPSDVLKAVNKRLNEDNKANMFVTSFIGILEIDKGKFVYSNAGHNPPLIYNGDEFKYLDIEPNFILGVMEDIDYIEQEVMLKKGDILYLYTDGVTEAMNAENQLFSEEQLKDKLNSKNINSMTVTQIVESLKEDIDKFTFGAQQSDDLTMLALKIE